MPVVLGAKLNGLVATHANNTIRWHVKKPEESDAASKVKHSLGKLVASFKCAQSIIYIIIRKEKASIYKLSRSKFAITDMR